MTEAPGTTNRRKSHAVVVSVGWVLIMVAVAVARGGVVPWVRWTAGAVAILIAVGLVVLTRKLRLRPPRPAGRNGKDPEWPAAEMFSTLVSVLSAVLAQGLAITWQGDPPLLVLAGVLGSIPFLALIWWKALRPNRTADAGQPNGN